jgi:PmbA protein
MDKETAAAIDLLQDLIAKARKAGADAADAVLVEGVSLSHARRLGKTEKLERSEGQDLGLRVLIGKRQAMASSSDRSAKTLAELVERTVAMAQAVPEDPFCGLADPAEIARAWPALDMLDPDEPSAETLIERARAAEEAALAVTGVTNSEGADAGWGRSRVALAASNGFAGGYCGRATGAASRCSAAAARRWSATTISPVRSMPPICATRLRSGARPARRPSSGSARARCRPANTRRCSIRASRAA